MSAAAPLVRFEGVTRRFGGTAAVDGVDLEIREGEFFALLGPSGCGKTTLMRLLAGFETPDEGRVLLAGRDLAGTPPHRRPVNMMFQSYALFPHLTVEKNVAFGLAMEGMKPAAIRARVEEMLTLVRLEGLGRRRPDQLSGGQRQRVALARAIARRPRLLLLDEPLAALDRKLREQTQFELKTLQEQLGMTFLIVTHDQDEAMVLADRIAVMDRGRILQVGAPTELYEAPASRAVAEFLGDINIFDGTVEAMEGARATILTGAGPFLVVVQDLDLGDRVALAVRPEKMRLSLVAPGADNVLAGTVRQIGYLGDWTTYVVEIAPGRLVRVARANESRGGETIARGDRVLVSFAADAGVALTL